MAEKNCEDLDYSVEDLEPSKTKLFTLHELPSITQSEAGSIHSPKIIVDDRYEDTDELAGGYAHSSDNHPFHSSNSEPIKDTKVTKKSNKINSLVHFFERKYSPIHVKGKGKAKQERQSSPKTEETHPITSVENKHPRKTVRTKLFRLNKGISRQESIDVIDVIECSVQDKMKKAKQFKKCRAASDDLNLSIDETNETNKTILQADPEHKHNQHLNISSNELTVKGVHIQNRFKKYRAASDDLNLSPSVDETNKTNEMILQDDPERKHNLNISSDELTVENIHVQNRLINSRPGNRYSKNLDALVKMKAAFISGESDDKEEALDLFKSKDHNPPLTADTNINAVPDQIVPDEPSEARLTPDVSEKVNVTSKQDASEIEEVATGTPSDERALENLETAVTATMMTKKNKSRKSGKREDLRTRDDRIKELLDILTKHVKSIVELQEENTNLKKDLEEMESVNSKQYELIFHLSKANIDHYQHKSMDSGGEKSERFSKRGSKSLDIILKQEMPDLIPGTEKAMSDY